MKKHFLFSALLALACCLSALTTVEAKETAVSPGTMTVASVSPKNEAAGPNGGFSSAFSPDGGRIAFLSSTLHAPTDLWVMNADGTGARRLTTRGIRNFRWAEDGASLRFTTVRKGFAEVMTIAADGGGEEMSLTSLPTGADLPVYSPDGKLFALTVPGKDKVRNLWIGTADGARLEAVTEKIGIRSLFWHPDSRKIYYEAGSHSYGVGIWEIDLSTMESKSLLGKYIGTPVYSPQVGLVAYPYPVNPGEFEVQTMLLDGSGIKSYPSPRLAGRDLLWDTSGKGVYYLGQDIEIVTEPEGLLGLLKGLFSWLAPKEAEKQADEPTKDAEAAAPLHKKEKVAFNRVGLNSLWYLDLATGSERRVSPPEFQVSDFALAPDGRKITLVGLMPVSYTTEIFSLDLASAALVRLTPSRASAWLPTPAQDSAKIAYFTNKERVDALTIVNRQGVELASYPGIAQTADTRIFWLPQSDGLLVYSSRGLLAFTEQGGIDFPGQKDHREFLGADVSIQEDKVLLISIPAFGETPGLYMLEAVDSKFVQTDLRFPKEPSEYAPELYMQPRWSLDGKKIAFTDRIDICIMNADGTKRTLLTSYAERNSVGKEQPALASYPVWSARGEMIAFTLTVFADKHLLRQLWVMKADGSEPKMLHSQMVDSQFQVYLPEYTSLPFFNFDDTRIIFTIPDNGVPNIYSVDIADATLRRLTEDGAVFPALLPEEGVIVYTSLADNSEKLMVMGSDGSGKQPLLPKASAAPEAAPAAAMKKTGEKEPGK
ncbi:MAG: hypothetical protein A2505_08715 [Deltaproteobacteria bacterium RIFOXYD12_FULL_55_16]|nr:MAG: hypothetical protein A2505_08715 [Deltaproteobacteria bacterium RIFOXYD12_FULL_55_16]